MPGRTRQSREDRVILQKLPKIGSFFACRYGIIFTNLVQSQYHGMLSERMCALKLRVKGYLYRQKLIERSLNRSVLKRMETAALIESTSRSNSITSNKDPRQSIGTGLLNSTIN